MSIQLEIHDGVACVTLNRPEAMNAMTQQMDAQLRAIWPEVNARSDVHAGLLLAPASVVGFGLSGPLRRYLDGPATRWAVLIISTLSASAVLIRLVT